LQKLEDLVFSPVTVRVKFTAGITDTGLIAAEGSIGSDNRAFLLEPRFVTHSGPGCAPAGAGVPRLGITGIPGSNGKLAFLAAGGHGGGGGVGVFALSLNPGNTPLPAGCSLLVDLSTALLVPQLENPIGQASHVLQLPGMVFGTRIHAQYASIDFAAGLGSLAISNAVHVDLN
jgi:hypothetical protein